MDKFRLTTILCWEWKRELFFPSSHEKKILGGDSDWPSLDHLHISGPITIGILIVPPWECPILWQAGVDWQLKLSHSTRWEGTSTTNEGFKRETLSHLRKVEHSHRGPFNIQNSIRVYQRNVSPSKWQGKVTLNSMAQLAKDHMIYEWWLCDSVSVYTVFTASDPMSLTCRKKRRTDQVQVLTLSTADPVLPQPAPNLVLGDTFKKGTWLLCPGTGRRDWTI